VPLAVAIGMGNKTESMVKLYVRTFGGQSTLGALPRKRNVKQDPFLYLIPLYMPHKLIIPQDVESLIRSTNFNSTVDNRAFKWVYTLDMTSARQLDVTNLTR
jgi:hypothetical protein